jgi:membrane associated rhomboid family serine protease
MDKDDNSEDDRPRRHWEPALNPLPPLVWALSLPIIVLEIVLGLADAGLVGGAEGIGWRMQTLQQLVFAPDHLRWIWQTGHWMTPEASRILTYAFVHFSLGHAAFVVVFLLALGKFVSEALRSWAIVVVFLGSSVGAAVIYAMAGQTVPLAGGYPGVFGLVGAFTLLLWAELRQKGANPARAFALIGALLLVRLIFGLMLGFGPDWIADLAGFVVGAVLTLLLSPYLRHVLRERLQSR